VFLVYEFCVNLLAFLSLGAKKPVSRQKSTRPQRGKEWSGSAEDRGGNDNDGGKCGNSSRMRAIREMINRRVSPEFVGRLFGTLPDPIGATGVMSSVSRLAWDNAIVAAAKMPGQTGATALLTDIASCFPAYFVLIRTPHTGGLLVMRRVESLTG
jgi:hypothetical protein